MGGTEFATARTDNMLQLPTGLPAALGRRSLVIIDEADLADGEALSSVVSRLDRANVSLLLTSRHRLDRVLSMGTHRLDRVPELAYLSLGSLSTLEVEAFVAELDLHPAVLASLIREAAGNPLTLNLLAHYANEGKLADVVRALGANPVSTILSPDGRGLTSTDEGLRAIEATAGGISNSLIRALAGDPELMYSISPRRFEELVADLYEREGYEVELTPVSRDGGVDIYAVQRTAFGSFLTVIDCKRYRKDRPIEVGLVRQLLGTVEAHDASIGVLATTSFFTRGAQAFQHDRKYRLGLQDYLDLHGLLRRQATSSAD